MDHDPDTAVVSRAAAETLLDAAPLRADGAAKQGPASDASAVA
jgi:hypothetical protein